MGLKRVRASRPMGGGRLLPWGINSPTPTAPQTIALETKKTMKKVKYYYYYQDYSSLPKSPFPSPLLPKDSVTSGQIPMVPEKAVGP